MDETRIRPDLEQDLIASGKIRLRCQERRYAQNLYAALCNQPWQKQEVWPLLCDDTWSCTWRYAAGIAAHLRDCNEDYLDYYCSGIQDFTADYADTNFTGGGFVNEGTVTEEIQQDLLELGWQPVDNNSEVV